MIFIITINTKTIGQRSITKIGTILTQKEWFPHIHSNNYCWISTVDTVHVNVANDCQKQSVSKGDSDTETFIGVCHCIYPFSKESKPYVLSRHFDFNMFL